MQHKKRPVRTSIDGFVPRSPRSIRRRSSVSNEKMSHSNEELEPPVAKETTDLLDDVSELQSDDVGSLKQPIDLGKLPAVPKKPRWWQLSKKKKLRKERQSRRKKIVKRIALVIVLIGLCLGLFVGWKFLRTTTKVFKGNILGLLNTTKLNGEETGRVNVLLTGTSEDDPGHNGAKLTDSIMIVSIDTVNNKAFLLSIPRDLWVNYGTKGCWVGYQGKINAVYTCGEQVKFNEAGYAPGGIGLLEKVVSQNFGININYYAKIDYSAFKEAIDTVGGIDITLKTDSPNGILDRIFDWECKYKCYKVKYPNGPLHLNGQQALDLSRARGDSTGYPTYGTGNDFGRTERQRQMLIALKDKTLSAGILTNPAKISSLLDATGDNVVTNFKTSELRRLYDLGKNIKSQNIKSIGLTDEDVSLVQTFQAIDGSSAVRPVAGTYDFSQIQAYLKKLTSNDPVVQEGAKVVVLNASGVVGLAQTEANKLKDKNITVTSVGNASAIQASTTIINLNNGHNLATKKFLETQYSVVASTDVAAHPELKNYQADFVILLGKPAVTTPTN